MIYEDTDKFATLYAGNCEQFEYTIRYKDQMHLFNEICKILHLDDKTKRVFKRLPTREGYPKGAVHYEVTGGPSSILVIYKET